MAEAMISESYRESVQSLDRLVLDAQATQPSLDLFDGSSKEEKRVKHGPTTVIQIPDKRRKVSTSITAKNVIESISTAISYEDRREAICTATTSFDHNMQSLHDEELEVGADAVLSKHLGFLISRRHVQPEDTVPSLMHEISCTCEALEMVFRASPHAVEQSFNRFGYEILATMVHLINHELAERSGGNESKVAIKTEPTDSLEEDDNNTQSNSQQDPSITSEGSRSVTPPSPPCPAIAEESGRRDHDVMLRKATKVMGHFARVGSATQPMAYYPGLLTCLISVLSVNPYHIIPAEVRLNSLWILANLACNSENMVMMACHPRLLSSLIVMASRQVCSNDSAEVIVEIFRSRSIASRALVNLSWAPENQIPMSENHALVEALLPLAVLRESPFGKRGRTVREMILQTRRHSISTLRNLAAAPRRNKILLCQFNQGNLLNILTDSALNDPDTDIRERAFATIQNLAIHDTATMMVQNPALILALKDALLYTDGLDEDNSDTPIKQSASATLLVLERSITPDDMDRYQTLRDLLESVNDPSNSQNDDSSDDQTTSPTPV